VIKQVNPPHQVWIANLNCPGQVVIAGSKTGIEAAVTPLKAKGAKRVLPLDVSGAFHSGLMQEAQNRLQPKIQETQLIDSPIQLVMNVPGDYVSDAHLIRQNLIMQVTSPVRWEQGIRAMVQDGIEIYVEIGCGKTLQGMNKRIGVAQPTISIEKISDLETLSQLEMNHATIER
jgi:[acyl-carrier-protein] S-malonyltransferase